MERTIKVSTEVYAAIWAARKAGEETESDVLHRILCPTANEDVSNGSEAKKTNGSGFYDLRNKLLFQEGFEIFRVYKGNEYTARANNGAWIRTDNSKRYASLNQLNSSIVIGSENVWNGNWKYREADGKICSINHLRG